MGDERSVSAPWLVNLSMLGTEISRKLECECLSLLYACALEVPVKQKKDGGGLTYCFIGAAVL